MPAPANARPKPTTKLPSTMPVSAHWVKALKFISRTSKLRDTTLNPEMTKLKEIHRRTGRSTGVS